MTGGVEVRRRVAAYGSCRDRDGRVLLVRASPASVRPGTWLLPGGGVDHGEHPADTLVREVAEETGLTVEAVGLRDVLAEVITRPPGLEHTDGVIYEVAVTGGALRPETGGSSNAVRWATPDEMATLPVSRFAAHLLGLPPPTAPAVPPMRAHRADPGSRPARGQRFGAYGLATDPEGRVLLTLIADGYPGAGRWHLPGGGTDFGEQPVPGLLREITEESGQVGRVAGLVAVTHHHNPAAVGPEGHPIDWHGIRAVYRVDVPHPSRPRVLDEGGSTAAAGWFTRTDAAALPLTDLAAALLEDPP